MTRLFNSWLVIDRSPRSLMQIVYHNITNKKRDFYCDGFCISPHDQIQDLLGEGDHNTAGQGQEAVGPLGGIMALE